MWKFQKKKKERKKERKKKIPGIILDTAMV